MRLVITEASIVLALGAGLIASLIPRTQAYTFPVMAVSLTIFVVMVSRVVTAEWRHHTRKPDLPVGRKAP